MTRHCARNCDVSRDDKVCQSLRRRSQISPAQRDRKPLQARACSGGDRRFGTVVALSKFVSNDRIRSRVLKGLMLTVSTTLMASAFVHLGTQTTTRSLMLLGAGLVSLATLSRRHFADEQ